MAKTIKYKDLYASVFETRSMTALKNFNVKSIKNIKTKGFA